MKRVRQEHEGGRQRAEASHAREMENVRKNEKDAIDTAQKVEGAGAGAWWGGGWGKERMLQAVRGAAALLDKVQVHLRG